jgi:hypothetical protein
MLLRCVPITITGTFIQLALSFESHPEMSGALNRAPVHPFKMNGDYRQHTFGCEMTVEEIVRRISWETEAEGIARKEGNEILALAF